MPFTPLARFRAGWARERQKAHRESKSTTYRALTVTRISMPSHSKQRTERSDSPLAAEEWQLRILRELHEKKPRPTVEQRKLLATQTGL
jgi:hypothetical protein